MLSYLMLVEFVILEDSKNNNHRMTTVPSDIADRIKSLPPWGTFEKCKKDINPSNNECQYVFTRNGKPIKDIRKVS